MNQFTSAVFNTGLDPIWGLFLPSARAYFPTFWWALVFVAIVSFWLGNIVATRSLYRTNCSCHSPFRWAALKYLGMSLSIAVIFAGCSATLRCRVVDGVEVCQSRPQCRDVATGQFVACPDKVVLEEMRATQREVEKKAAMQRAEGRTTRNIHTSTSCAVLHMDKDGNQIPCPGYP